MSVREKLEYLRERMQWNYDNPMDSWETGRCIADNTVEYWIELLDEILLEIPQNGKS